MLSCRDLTKKYGDIAVFRSLSLELSESSISVLRGPSGCGKSSLLKCLSLMSDWDEGEVRVNDLRINSRDSQVEKKRQVQLLKGFVSVVFQRLFLWPHLTCRENIGIMSAGDGNFKYAELLGVDSVLDKRVGEISIGQAQRVAFLRAVASSPKYLFLDEVTSALDRKNTMLMAEVINELKSYGMGILCISHSDEFCSCLDADRAYEMNNGDLNDVF